MFFALAFQASAVSLSLSRGEAPQPGSAMITVDSTARRRRVPGPCSDTHLTYDNDGHPTPGFNRVDTAALAWDEASAVLKAAGAALDRLLDNAP